MSSTGCLEVVIESGVTVVTIGGTKGEVMNLNPCRHHGKLKLR